MTQERAVPQDSSKATLAHKLSSAEAEVDFSLQTAGDIVRRHRALSHQVSPPLRPSGDGYWIKKS